MSKEIDGFITHITGGNTVFTAMFDGKSYSTTLTPIEYESVSNYLKNRLYGKAFNHLSKTGTPFKALSHKAAVDEVHANMQANFAPLRELLKKWDDEKKK